MTIHIDSSKRYQQMEHFGASAAWWAQDVGTWPEESVQRVVDLLFDRTRGIGLNLIRYNLGGGKDEAQIADPWRSAALPLTPQGTFDWSRDAAAVSVVDKAVRKGAQVLLFSNSPPASMTVTGRPTGNARETNLRPDAREAFARYLADATESLQTRGWPVIAVSPINEPQWDWQPSKGQEGSYYSPADAHALLTAVVRQWKARGLTPALSAIDSGEWKLASNLHYLDEIWGDPELRPWLDHYAVHSYWSQTEDREALAAYVSAHFPGVRLWQSEWTEMKGGRDPGMDSALVLARTVADDLVTGGVTSWQAWIAVSKYDFRDGLVSVDEGLGTVTATKRLWALGNWSRFVMPGARRVAASAPETIEAVTAFENPDGTLVVVLVNGGPLPAVVDGVDARASAVSVWETSSQHDLEMVYYGPPIRLLLPERSITTLVVRR